MLYSVHSKNKPQYVVQIVSDLTVILSEQGMTAIQQA